MASTSTSFHSLSSSSFVPQQRRAPHSPASCVTFRRPLPSVSAVACLPTTSFYEVLGIQDGATCREIKAAYRKLVRVVHPDVVAAKTDGGKDATSAVDEFMRVHEAYATLSDPAKRAVYDRMLFFKRRRLSYSPNYAMATAKCGTTSFFGFSGYTRRTWETDQCW